jgi:hypothetical protein
LTPRKPGQAAHLPPKEKFENKETYQKIKKLLVQQAIIFTINNSVSNFRKLLFLQLKRL